MPVIEGLGRLLVPEADATYATPTQEGWSTKITDLVAQQPKAKEMCYPSARNRTTSRLKIHRLLLQILL